MNNNLFVLCIIFLPTGIALLSYFIGVNKVNQRKIVWIVMKQYEPEDIQNRDLNGGYEICGVYDSKEKALAQCKDYHYSIGPLELNKNEESNELWSGHEYPFSWTVKDYARIFQETTETYLKKFKETYPGKYDKTTVEELKKEFDI